MVLKRFLWVLGMVLFLNSQMAEAKSVPIPPLNLPELTNGSDLIVVGQVTNLVKGGRTTIKWQNETIPAWQMVATFRVDRIVKGQLSQTNLFFDYLQPVDYTGYKTITKDQFGMFFLQKTAQPEEYTVTSAYYPYFFVSPQSPFREANDLDRVVAEIIQVLKTPGVTINQTRESLEVLSSLDMQPAIDALRNVAHTGRMPMRLWAANALLSRNDLSALDEVAEILMRSPTNEVWEGGCFSCGGGVERVTDPKAIPILTRLLKAPYSGTRWSAVYALRMIGTETAIEPLVEALNDDSQEIRYQAVVGLSEISRQNGEKGWWPDEKEFKQEEQKFLTFWREWAKKRQKVLIWKEDNLP